MTALTEYRRLRSMRMVNAWERSGMADIAAAAFRWLSYTIAACLTVYLLSDYANARESKIRGEQTGYVEALQAALAACLNEREVLIRVPE